MPNKSRFHCDLCHERLWMNPGGGIYCNDVHPNVATELRTKGQTAN